MKYRERPLIETVKNRFKRIKARIVFTFYDLLRVLFIGFYSFITRIKVFNHNNIPEDSTIIFAVNHTNGADPIVLLGAIRQRIVFLAGSENFKNRFTNFFMRKFCNAIPVFKKQYAKNIKSFKEVFRLSKEKKLFAIFPEGHLWKHKGFDRFNKGAAYLSFKTKIPIIPVYIHNLRKGFSTKTWFGRRNMVEGLSAIFINAFNKINVLIGEPIDPMTEDILEDFGTRDAVSKKAHVESINRILVEQFEELEETADEIISLETAN